MYIIAVPHDFFKYLNEKKVEEVQKLDKKRRFDGKIIAVNVSTNETKTPFVPFFAG